MAALAHLLGRVGRGVARGGRAINDALTDEEIDPNTGEVIRRPSRVAQGLGEAIRAGIVAAGSPTPGHVGTAQDIFGGLRAVEQDRQVRQDRATQQRRQQMSDQMAQQRNAREMRDSDAEYELRKAQRTKEEALAAKAERQQAEDPEDIKRYEYAHKQALAAGLGPDKAHAHGMAAMTRQTTGFLAPVSDPNKPPTGRRDPLESARALMQENDTLSDPAMTAFFDPKGERYDLNERLVRGAMGAKDPAPQVMPTEDGIVVVDPKTATSKPVKSPSGRTAMPYRRPTATPAAKQPRFRIDTKADGKRVRVNLDSGEVTELGYEARPPGKPPKASPLGREVAKSKEGSAKPTKKATPEMVRAFAAEMKVDLNRAKQMFRDEGYEVQ